MNEQLIIRFKLPLINHLPIIKALVVFGFRKTGNKFSVVFNGSKGYLDNIEIICEGWQKENNRIDLFKLTNKNGTLRNVVVNIFHSHENGVRVSIGKDEPRVIEEKQEKKVKEPVNDDLPF